MEISRARRSPQLGFCCAKIARPAAVVVLGREVALSIVRLGVCSHSRHILVMIDAALPSATNNANKQLIDTLLRSRLFRDYESVFTKATGLALALRPLDYWQLEQ